MCTWNMQPLTSYLLSPMLGQVVMAIQKQGKIKIFRKLKLFQVQDNVLNDFYLKWIQSLGCIKFSLDWGSFTVRVILTFAVISFWSTFIFQLQQKNGRFDECNETLEIRSDARKIITYGTNWFATNRERTAYFHALPMHSQVTQSMNLDVWCLDTRKCAWNLENGYLGWTKADIDCAPEFLLNCTRCKSKKILRNPVGSLTDPKAITVWSVWQLAVTAKENFVIIWSLRII